MHNYKKSLGQNFIYDSNLLQAIVLDAQITKDDTVIEIGAGAGTLSAEIAKVCKHLYSFEIDKDLQHELDKLVETHSNVTIIWQDFLNVDDAFFAQFDKFKVIANLPYYITTPIVFKLIKYRSKISSMSVMVQQEVGERFCAKPNSKEYGIPSIILQSIADVSITRNVNKNCFKPVPKVDSCIVKIDFFKTQKFDNFDKFCDFVKLCFSMRRKTLLNNLKMHQNYDKKQIIDTLKKLGYEENVRPENISVIHYKKIFEKMLNN